jgi:hypothetical protein
MLHKVPPEETVISPLALPVDVIHKVLPGPTMWFAELGPEIVVVQDVHCAFACVTNANIAAQKKE